MFSTGLSTVEIVVAVAVVEVVEIIWIGCFKICTFVVEKDKDGGPFVFIVHCAV